MWHVGARLQQTFDQDVSLPCFTDLFAESRRTMNDHLDGCKRTVKAVYGAPRRQPARFLTELRDAKTTSHSPAPSHHAGVMLHVRRASVLVFQWAARGTAFRSSFGFFSLHILRASGGAPLHTSHKSFRSCVLSVT